MKTKPSFSDFKALATQGNVIPVYREFLGDTETPVSTYLKIKEKHLSYLLESAEGSEKWGRYSFIGYMPYLTIISREGEMEVREAGVRQVLRNVDNPLEVLRNISRRFEPVPVRELPPFQGGLVGYCNYELIRKWERLPGLSPVNGGMPESVFTVSRRMIIFDHRTHRITVVVFAFLNEGEDLEKCYRQACQELEEAMEELQSPLPAVPGEEVIRLSGLEPNVSKERFEESVRKAKTHIEAGDVIQVVLSQRFSADLGGDAFTLYRNLRSINPSPYMFYLNFGEVKLIGSSPEILVRLTGGKIELRPIAGTRPRGQSPEEDRELERELLSDPKERAEHIMLVDLGRNDTGRVAVSASVTVPRLMEVERYSHVMHIVSRVEGQLKPDMDAFDLFMAAFPAGTVTGAPKIRAMEIISDLEPTCRGPYAGGVGYFGFNGNMDFCITIRTMAMWREKLSIQVGAGIVADSTPEGEYEETLKKAAAMFKVLEKVTDNDSSYR
ncbi:MAG: anthranilate synthase component I [Deltaproteobacteria bacterium]|nr:anthranilate synthase component I [Deltaproteobacteria bacterium]